jgi:ABC-type enterochelin transport system permease subunit
LVLSEGFKNKERLKYKEERIRMEPIIHNENKIVIPFLGIIFLAAVAIVAVQHFFNRSFGWLGFLSWIIVIIGAIYFVLWILVQIFGG